MAIMASAEPDLRDLMHSFAEHVIDATRRRARWSRATAVVLAGSDRVYCGERVCITAVKANLSSGETCR
ncbi:hypothetical protein StoSoilB3_12320 [Arthrobacter sp. StoSoilB3]|nr:hypothetical protein NtRootA2_12160 [Arthrobacter sp. NtRootA2]BCW26619.1 hypothetical protein NtRootC45_12190 [Arthrobacter sp. NtRootC45]BCW30889.1 hypothetical protein NtRootD5_12200 [Arthrobacter sp. NtRootD5]BCW39697.1 hypothetical protein StoSoilB3_12320 [Arthrobacter sp. StoSoilB3]GGV32121.1 hypothetical protein GCM10010212_19460 [Paenarthrobacter nicotinovorans]